MIIVERITCSCVSKLWKKLSLERLLHLAKKYGKSSRQFHFFIIVAYVKSWSISVSAVENHITFALLVLLSGLTFFVYTDAYDPLKSFQDLMRCSN